MNIYRIAGSCELFSRKSSGVHTNYRTTFHDNSAYTEQATKVCAVDPRSLQSWKCEQGLERDIANYM